MHANGMRAQSVASERKQWANKAYKDYKKSKGGGGPAIAIVAITALVGAILTKGLLLVWLAIAAVAMVLYKRSSPAMRTILLAAAAVTAASSAYGFITSWF